MQASQASSDQLDQQPASPFARAAGRLAGRSEKRWPRLSGTSEAVRRLEDNIARVATFDCSVLITGETGCGKEEVARAIHAAGPRHEKPFVAINCGGLVADLAESQLFGHEKGAFTGAFGASRGAFRAAEGGIIFLDEIGELPIDLQPKLLRVLQRWEVTPVGSTEAHPIDVQVIAATNRDLDAEVSSGRFREDLLFRLNTIHLAVPPLRSRMEDIPRFVEHFSAHFAREYGRPQWTPEPRMLERFARHSWPGNVRQLAQTIQRVYVFEDRVDSVLAEVFDAAAAPAARPLGDARIVDAPAEQPAATTAEPDQAPAVANEPRVPIFNLDELRRLAVRQAMAFTSGHRGQAAALLGVSLNTMTRLVAESCPEMAAKSGRRPAAAPTRPK
ncbi:MAG: sigma-54-dependent Fis family transcriptional regulator [Planctomycetes bacterium]|nr:sigma-54-dependent Fis family transcriptional regulator [Planctomycetota bacterium]